VATNNAEVQLSQEEVQRIAEAVWNMQTSPTLSETLYHTSFDTFTTGVDTGTTWTTQPIGPWTGSNEYIYIPPWEDRIREQEPVVDSEALRRFRESIAETVRSVRRNPTPELEMIEATEIPASDDPVPAIRLVIKFPTTPVVELSADALRMFDKEIKLAFIRAFRLVPPPTATIRRLIFDEAVDDCSK
jgi:hypothetical protein